MVLKSKGIQYCGKPFLSLVFSFLSYYVFFPQYSYLIHLYWSLMHDCIAMYFVFLKSSFSKKRCSTFKYDHPCTVNSLFSNKNTQAPGHKIKVCFKKLFFEECFNHSLRLNKLNKTLKQGTFFFKPSLQFITGANTMSLFLCNLYCG